MREQKSTRSRTVDDHDVDEMAVVLGKLVDDDPCDQEEEGQSTLLDRYERLSFEVHLKQAMLGRSLSEPSSAVARTGAAGSCICAASLAAQKGKQGGAAAGLRKSRIHKFVKMLIKPLVVGTTWVFVRKDIVRSSTPDVLGKDHHKYWWKAACSRSMRGV